MIETFTEVAYRPVERFSILFLSPQTRNERVKHLIVETLARNSVCSLLLGLTA